MKRRNPMARALRDSRYGQRVVKLKTTYTRNRDKAQLREIKSNAVVDRS